MTSPNLRRFHEAAAPLDLAQHQVVSAYLLGALANETPEATFDAHLTAALAFAAEVEAS